MTAVMARIAVVARMMIRVELVVLVGLAVVFGTDVEVVAFGSQIKPMFDRGLVEPVGKSRHRVRIGSSQANSNLANW